MVLQIDFVSIFKICNTSKLELNCVKTKNYCHENTFILNFSIVFLLSIDCKDSLGTFEKSVLSGAVGKYLQRINVIDNFQLYKLLSRKLHTLEETLTNIIIS